MNYIYRLKLGTNNGNQTYQGAGKMTVSRSEMAMDIRTRLVGDLMCFLLRTMMMRMLAMKVTVRIAGMMYP